MSRFIRAKIQSLDTECDCGVCDCDDNNECEDQLCKCCSLNCYGIRQSGKDTLVKR